jgi:hypothetical protein
LSWEIIFVCFKPFAVWLPLLYYLKGFGFPIPLFLIKKWSNPDSHRDKAASPSRSRIGRAAENRRKCSREAIPNIIPFEYSLLVVQYRKFLFAETIGFVSI